MKLATVTRLRLLAALGIARCLFSAACTLGVLTVGVFAAVQTVRTIAGGTLDSPLFFTCLLPMVFVSFFAICVGAAVSGLRARKRYLDRIAAMSGRQDLLTASRLEVRPASAPELDARPLTIQIASGLLTRRYLTLPYWLGSVVAGPLLAVLAVLFLFFDLDADAVKVLVAVCFALLAVSGPPWRGAWSLSGRAACVEADLAGLAWGTLVGGVCTMSWQDVKLIEVRPAPDAMSTEKRVMVLVYGPDAILRWRDQLAERRYALRRTQPLLDLVAARSGLTPRTFDDELAAYQQAGLPPNMLRIPGISNVTYLAEPSTTITDHSASVPPFDASPYSVVWRQHSARARVIAGLAGALLTAMCLVACLSLFTAIPAIPHLPVGAPQWLAITVGIAALFSGFIGAPLLLSMLLPERPLSVRADDHGLTAQHYGHATTVAWADLRNVAHLTLRRSDIYEALDHAQHAAVVWPGAPLVWTGPLPLDIGRLLAPDEFARFVASRIQAARQTSEHP